VQKEYLSTRVAREATRLGLFEPVGPIEVAGAHPALGEKTFGAR
jgi:hypothetical protein